VDSDSEYKPSGSESDTDPDVSTPSPSPPPKRARILKSTWPERGDPSWHSNSSNHLTRTEKENIKDFIPEGKLTENDKYDLTASLSAVNDNQKLLDRFDKEAAITANIDIKAIDAEKYVDAEKIGTVKVRGENNHLTDHANNTKNLIAEYSNSH
jgi:hypothetical protein